MRSSILAIALALAGAIAPEAQAWENHYQITRLALQGTDQWHDAPFEPIEAVLKDIQFEGYKVTDRKAFWKVLKVRGHHIDWDAKPPEPQDADTRGLTIVAWSAMTPDQGMDQNYNLSPDQEYMGGYTGPSSQAYRHMYFPAWDWRQPLITFHFPNFRKPMGQAPDRAQIFFDLAVQAKKTGHWFWAYRFLGFALHYIADLNQPYHCSQFGSVVLLPYPKIFKGKDAFVKETTRIVSNYHLGFERHVDFLLDQTKGNTKQAEVNRMLLDAFKVPTASELLVSSIQNQYDRTVRDGAVIMCRVSAMLAPSVVREQLALMGDELKHPATDLGPGFFNQDGTPKLDFTVIEKTTSTGDQKKRKMLVTVAAEALSNTGMSIRWVFDKFRLYER